MLMAKNEEKYVDRQTSQTERKTYRDLLRSRHWDLKIDRQTDTYTHTKVNTDDTLSEYQEFSLIPIIRDRSNKN